MDMHNVDPSNMFAQILQACSLDQCDMLPRLHPLYTRAIKLCSITQVYGNQSAHDSTKFCSLNMDACLKIELV